MSAATFRTPVLLLLLVLAAALLAAGCGGDSGSDDGGGAEQASSSEAEGGGSAEDVAERDGMYDEPPTEKLDPEKTYVVAVETNKGTFDLTVDPKAAPIAAANFVFLVKEGFYDGTVFHRIIKDFMIQGGDPTGTGIGGPGYELTDDPVKGEYSRGTVAMANAGPDTGGSQFFIVQGTNVAATLPKDYVIFGRVDEDGMKVVDEIAEVEVETSPNGEPSQPVDEVKIIEATLTES